MAKVAPLEHTDFTDNGKTIEADGERQDTASQLAENAVATAVQESPPQLVKANTRHGTTRTVGGTTVRSSPWWWWYDSPVASATRRTLRGRAFSALTMVCLLIALFFGDLWQILQVPSSLELDILLCIIFAIFALEFFGLSLSDFSYLLGFFFWTDFLGTASMAFDISFMAGEDATQPYRVSRTTGQSGGEITFVRAARATRLGARAGRISRVLKILRYLSVMMRDGEETDARQVKMARIISNQLTNVLSTRVAFLTIAVVIVIPVLGMFAYPEVDDSLAAWTEMLNQNARTFHAAWTSQNSTRIDSARALLNAEVLRFSDFYSTLNYGPFKILFGETRGDAFVPRPDILSISIPWTFSNPRRQSSVSIFNQDMLQVYYDLSATKQQEAGAAMGLICFTILVMCAFGLVMSSSISAIALEPLERMLSVVRERCKQIFKYTKDLEDTGEGNTDKDPEEYEDMSPEQASEFMLLEKVIAKLTAIVHLSTNREPEVKEDMNDDEIMALSWMQGVSAATATTSRTTAVVPSRPTMMAATANSLTPCIVAELNTDTFSTLDMVKETKIAVAHFLVTSTEGCSVWVQHNVQDQQLMTFINTVESKYLPNPFHNFAHAIDVEYTVYRYMSLIEADNFLSDVQIFWLLIAAIAHDVGHLGVNNQYLVETTHDLAVRYNDRSPLENMHCAKLFQIASDPEANIFAQLEKDIYKEIRKGMITSILHTDVTKHNEMIKEMSMIYQMNSEAFDSLEPTPAITQSAATTQLVANALLHGSDVGNPMKPWELCQRIAHLILDEFFAQGDLEKAAGIPVQMLNDRDKVNRPNSQLGFIEFVIAPMVVCMVNMFPQLDSLAMYLGQNIQHWFIAWEEEFSPSPDAIAKVKVRVQKVAAQCDGMMRTGDPA